jgi:hypothetical protein
MVETGASVPLRNDDPHEVETGRLLHQIRGKLPAPVNLLGTRLNHVAREVTHGIADHHLFVAQLEVHLFPIT